MSNFKKQIVRSPAHLAMVASLPCLATGRQDGVQAHHLLRGTGQKGMGIKSGDNWAVPLHHTVHNELHRFSGKGGETAFFAQYGIKNAPEVAATLYTSLTPEDAIEYIERTFSDNWKKFSIGLKNY